MYVKSCGKVWKYGKIYVQGIENNSEMKFNLCRKSTIDIDKFTV